MGTLFFVVKETSYNSYQQDPLTPLKFILWIIHEKQFSMSENAITIPFDNVFIYYNIFIG